jgi:hypothetical protein
MTLHKDGEPSLSLTNAISPHFFASKSRSLWGVKKATNKKEGEKQNARQNKHSRLYDDGAHSHQMSGSSSSRELGFLWEMEFQKLGKIALDLRELWGE